MSHFKAIFPRIWSLSRKVAIGAVIIVIAGMCMLQVAQWFRRPVDFSNPADFVVRITDPSGREQVYHRVNSFADDFETGIERTVEGWHQQMKLASGSNAGSPANRVETSEEQVHSGQFALKTYTPKDSRDLQKAAVLRELFFFPPGSDFWFSAWYFIPGKSNIENLFIFDLEATGRSGVGRRLMFTGSQGRYLMLEGKRSTGPQYAQTKTPVPFPRDQWVHLKLHLHLSPDHAGTVKLWQDGVLILNKQGSNIPRDTFYDRIEVGQTANSTHQEQIVYVDDVRVSDQPIDD